MILIVRVARSIESNNYSLGSVSSSSSAPLFYYYFSRARPAASVAVNTPLTLVFLRLLLAASRPVKVQRHSKPTQRDFCRAASCRLRVQSFVFSQNQSSLKKFNENEWRRRVVRGSFPEQVSVRRARKIACCEHRGIKKTGPKLLASSFSLLLLLLMLLRLFSILSFVLLLPMLALFFFSSYTSSSHPWTSVLV